MSPPARRLKKEERLSANPGQDLGLKFHGFWAKVSTTFGRLGFGALGVGGFQAFWILGCRALDRNLGFLAAWIGGCGLCPKASRNAKPLSPVETAPTEAGDCFASKSQKKYFVMGFTEM